MKFQVVAVNSETSESYSFIEFETRDEAIIYVRSKAKAFEQCGGWTLEIRSI